MTQEIIDLVRSLHGQSYKLYCALRQALGTPSHSTFLTWWRLVPRTARGKIKQAWRSRFHLEDQTAYVLYYRLQEQGTISHTDFDSWWQIIPAMPRIRILLCWWFFLKEGCHAVQVTKASGASEATIGIRLTPDTPLVMY